MSFGPSRTCSSSRRPTARVPLPFGRAWGALGEPLRVPAGLDGPALESHRAALEAALDRLTDEVDRCAGRARPGPRI